MPRLGLSLATSSISRPLASAPAFVQQTAPYASTASLSVVSPNPDVGTLSFTKSAPPSYYEYGYGPIIYVYSWQGSIEGAASLVVWFLGKNTNTNTWTIFGDHEDGDRWTTYLVATNSYTGNDIPLNGWTDGITITAA
jgi:hypothetical protein